MGSGASFPEDCIPSHWAQLEKEAELENGGDEEAGCEVGNKGVGGEILVTASKGQKGKERAQDWAGVRASPHY